MALRDVVARNLRSFRVRAGLTQDELSKRTKVNVRHLSQMENKGLNLTLDTLERLANGLGIAPFEFLKETERVSRPGRKRELPGIDAAIRMLKGYRRQLDDQAT